MIALEPVAYSHGDTRLTGLLARPAGLPRAGIVVYPTIANVKPAIERRARMLAEGGYLALIADHYGEQPVDPERTRVLAEALRADPVHYRARVSAAVDALAGLPEAESLPLVAIGYCMGGQAAIEAARAGHDLVLAASFHGILSTDLPAKAERIRARLLVCHGDADPLVPREAVRAFMEEMDAAGANWHLHAYSGVRHGFTDPESDRRGIDAVAYDASADRQSWTALLGLLDEILG